MKNIILLGFFILSNLMLAQDETEFLNSDDIKQIYQEQELIKKKSGTYFGLGTGMSIMRLIQAQEPEPFAPPTPYDPIVFTLQTGVQSFFTKNVGVRGFLALDMFGDEANYELKKIPYKSFFMMLSLGLDAIIEFALTQKNRHFLGFYAGAGVGGVIYGDNRSYSGLKNLYISGGFIVQGGIELTLAIRHRISLGIKITPIQKDILAPFIEQTDFLGSLMYSYLF